jgi:tRNA/tmRNA/rRNA uracil-C5-methylase (TrmA/RlmC/RlmD family)
VESAVEEWQPCRADVVIADPSRRGLGTAAVERVVATQASTLVLISCDPVALARDVTLLAAHYRLTQSLVLDLFPQTHHVEVVSRFERLPAARDAS